MWGWVLTVASAGRGARGRRLTAAGKWAPGAILGGRAPLLVLLGLTLGSLKHPCLLRRPLDDLAWVLLNSELGSCSGPRGLWWELMLGGGSSGQALVSTVYRLRLSPQPLEAGARALVCRGP